LLSSIKALPGLMAQSPRQQANSASRRPSGEGSGATAVSLPAIVRWGKRQRTSTMAAT
jgi:hypothetical protein